MIDKIIGVSLCMIVLSANIAVAGYIIDGAEAQAHGIDVWPLYMVAACGAVAGLIVGTAATVVDIVHGRNNT